jgi:hypothetical protein
VWVTFRDISGIQKTVKVLYIHPVREGDKWERAVARVFGIPTTVSDERTTAETDDVITCEPRYDTAAVGTTSTGFKKIPINSTGIPVGIQLVMTRQKVTLRIANNRPPQAVLNMARVHFGQNVEFAPPAPTSWFPNKIYQMRPLTLTSTPIITRQVRSDLAGDKIPVPITLGLGDHSYKEHGVMIPVVPAACDIVNAWWRIVEERNLTEPNFIGLSQESSDYVMCDGQGKGCDRVRAGMDIFLIPVVQLKPMSSQVQVWITATLKYSDEFDFSLGDQLTIDRNVSKQQVLDLWRPIHGQRDEYRDIVARFPSDAAECKWKDQFRPRRGVQLIGFSPFKKAKSSPRAPADGSDDSTMTSGARPPSVGSGAGPDTSADAGSKPTGTGCNTSERQVGTRNVTLTTTLEGRTCQASPRIDGNALRLKVLMELRFSSQHLYIYVWPE